MAFDPSVIGTIGDRVTRPIADAPAKAMELGDLINREQISRLGLKQEQETQATYAAIKKETQGLDWSDPDDQNKAVAIAAKHDPKVAMQMQRDFTQLQAGKLALTREELMLHNDKNDIIGAGATGIYEKGLEMKAKGVDDQTISATLLPAISQTIQGLKEQKLRNGKPVLSPEDMKNIDALLQPGANVMEGLSRIVDSSAKSREAIHQHLERLTANRRIDVSEAGEKERERHDREMEGLAAKKAAGGGGFSERAGDVMAALAEKGGGLPAGFRSKAQMQSTVEGILRRHPDLTADVIADRILTGQIDLKAETKETQIAAGIAGKIRYAEEEISRLAPTLMKASAEVPRGRFVPFNRLSQYTATQLSDPKLKQLKSYMTTFANAYDVLAARGGTDIEKRKHNREMFETADSPEALQAAVDAVVQEAKISGEAAQASEHRRPSSSTPSAPGASAAPPPAAPGAGGAGAQDQQALQWANANPNDPRAAAIKKRLGVR